MRRNKGRGGLWCLLTALDRPSIRPVPPDTLAEHAADIISFRSCERNLGGLLLHLMPEDVKKACLKTKQTSTLDILYQAHVSAGPGTRTDRHNTLEAVAKGKSVPTRSCYSELQDWKFASTRLVTMGVCHPDPSQQLEAIEKVAAKMIEEHEKSSSDTTHFA